jgi:hypothetical protein
VTYFAVILMFATAAAQAYGLFVVRSLWQSVKASDEENRKESKLWREHANQVLTQLSLIKLRQESAGEDFGNFQSRHDSLGD